MSSLDPARANKVDISSLTPEEQRILNMYGRLPSSRDIVQKKLNDRKYFDSGDYALSKAGKAASAGVTSIGSQHPVPENIPHSHSNSFSGPSGQGAGSPTQSQVQSPVKESNLVYETDADQQN
ncbi:camp-regulated phosphoprotein/endosulfine conserved region-domain-containing protein [Kockiozyma suomiensis]|uniref:camp-regulated phosphoprotein/endosulfine conserved region-domain-containing protein n=1 Tax=Kockiozyma suomiensis TaxID=1337062 RepID=UPI00334369AF